MKAARIALRAVMPTRGKRDSHPGLLLQRYLDKYATGELGDPENKRVLLGAAIDSAANGDSAVLYRTAFARWCASLPEDSARENLATRCRLVVGLGSENVLETGLRLHHTYGRPIIPGSALKGLAAHYCDQVWGPANRRFRKPAKVDEEVYRAPYASSTPKPEEDFHRLIFGATDDGGCIIFHDAWYVPDSASAPLVLEVVTPHHLKWLDGSSPPTDFDSPTPVPFIAVDGTFHVAVSWCGPVSDKARDWVRLALALLIEALKEWGVGGKTTSGYGRLTTPPPPPPPRERHYGESARVRIVAPRPKGGFDVQDLEPARKPGTLTLGAPPPGTDTNPGAVVDVRVHIDDAKRPQYKWPQTAKS